MTNPNTPDQTEIPLTPARSVDETSETPEPISETQEAPAQPEPQPEEFHFPDSPESQELAGLTVKEVNALFRVLKESAGAVGATPAMPPPPPPVPPANNGQNSHDAPAANPYLMQVAQQQAAILYGQAKREHAAIFAKYEPEIAGTLQRIPHQMWTMETIENAVNLTKGKHSEELFGERMRSVESTMGAALRSTGRGPALSVPTQKPAIDAGIARWQERAARAGIGERELLEMCKQQDLEPGEFFALFEHDIVTDAVADIGRDKRSGDV